MPTSVSLRYATSGAPRVFAIIRGIPDDALATSTLNKILRSWADNRVIPSAKRLAPKDTRALVNGIQAKVNGRERQVLFYSTARSKKGFPYWIVQERGTNNAFGRGIHLPARRFFARAINNNARHLNKRVADALQTAANRRARASSR